jgi:hypothetical protein
VEFIWKILIFGVGIQMLAPLKNRQKYERSEDMKFTALAMLVLFASYVRGSEFAELADIASLKWQKRIIVVNDVANQEAASALFESNSAEIDDRDIAWFVVKGETALTNYTGKLSKSFVRNTLARYRVGQGEVVLIGKDGGIKSRLDRVDLAQIFSKIDAMPMRRFEAQDE